jgi:hypothetical protein
VEVDHARPDDLGVLEVHRVPGVVQDQPLGGRDLALHDDHLVGVGEGVVLAGDDQDRAVESAEVGLGPRRVDAIVLPDLADEVLPEAGYLPTSCRVAKAAAA